MGKTKLLMVAAMLIVVTTASAQLNLGVKGGVNMSNFTSDDFSNKDAKIGFHVGLAADYEFAYNMAVQTGLYFTTKGAKFSESAKEGSVKATLNSMYLQLPVHYAYKLDVSPGTRLVFHAGPYIAYGVGGKTKVKGSIADQAIVADGVKVFGDKGILKAFDTGLGLGVGAEFGPLLLDLGWDMGLVNISDIGGKVKNQNAYLSVGYKF